VLTVNFEIDQLELSEAAIRPLWDSKGAFSDTGYADDLQYTGKTLKPVPQICYLKGGYEGAKFKRSHMPVLKNKMFTTEYRDTTEIAKADDASAPTMILKPKDMKNFAAPDGKTQLEYRFNILPGDLTKAEIARVSVQTYKGAAVKPRPAVKLNGVSLKEGRDFSYVYNDNMAPGRGRVMVEPVKGNTKFVLNGTSPEAGFLIR
jgi:hypothetical protein